MKREFIYCETIDGGMQSHVIRNTKDLEILFGWMSYDCYIQDEALVEWCIKCNIGDYFEHRLGIIFRVSVVKDK